MPSEGEVGVGLELTGTVLPSDATNQLISWQVKSAGQTGATIDGNILTATSEGEVTVTAIIHNGVMTGVHFVKDFIIVINEGSNGEDLIN